MAQFAYRAAAIVHAISSSGLFGVRGRRALLGAGIIAGVTAGSATALGQAFADLTSNHYTAGQQVIIDVGKFPATFGCANNCPPLADCGFNDCCASGPDCDPAPPQHPYCSAIYPAVTAKVFIIPQSSVSSSRFDLWSQCVGFAKTIIEPSNHSGFISEVIGEVGTSSSVGVGFLGPGAYVVVFDECEDGFFDPGVDEVVAYFDVSIPDAPQMRSAFDAARTQGPPAIAQQQTPTAEWTFHSGDETGPLMVGAPGGAGTTANAWASASTGTLPSVGPLVSPGPTLTQYVLGREPSFNGVLMRPGATAGDGATLAFHPQSPAMMTNLQFLGEITSGAGDGVSVNVFAVANGGVRRSLIPTFNMMPTPIGFYAPPLVGPYQLCTCDTVAAQLLPRADNTGDQANVSMVLGLVPPAPPPAAFSEDFNGLTVGNINGQNGWMDATSFLPCKVAAGAGFDGSNALQSPPPFNVGSGVYRYLPHTFAYAATSSTIWKLKAKVTGGAGQVRCATFGLTNGAAGLLFGIQGLGPPGFIQTALWGTSAGNLGGDHLSDGHWYDFQFEIDFTQTGGKGTLRYRDLTNGEVTFRTDAVIVNRPLELKLVSGAYTFTYGVGRTDVGPDSNPVSYLDDLYFDDPALTTITAQPGVGSGSANHAAILSVTASSLGPLTYRWQIESAPAGSNAWTNLANGPIPGTGSSATGADTANLALANIDSDTLARRYRCVVTNTCAIVTSDPTTLASCPADLNGDGIVEDADFVIFVIAYNTLDCADPVMPAGCPADLNRDGIVEDSDFVIFVAAYNELLCP